MTKLYDDDLRRQLQRQPHQTGNELAEALGISGATLSRRLRTLGPELLRSGSTKNARYALQKPLRGRMEKVPVYAVDEEGIGILLGALAPTEPRGAFFECRGDLPWPLDGKLMKQGWWDGLPYPIYDMRPSGFLGRNFAHQSAARLDVSSNPEDWSDDDIFYVLSREGSDTPGNWIIGNAAYRLFLEQKNLEKRFFCEGEIPRSYPDLALNALADGFGGSSAAGEFPKFITARMIDGRSEHVIVKFSGAGGSAGEQRWSDLLVCEHLALATIKESSLGLPVPNSRIHQLSGRSYLETVRFDRHGEHGRSPACTLESINNALIGRAEATWPEAARELMRRGFLSQDATVCIERLWWFGKLIGNTDMHNGNLSFTPGLNVAPIYDMLPMLFAPQRGGELPERELKPELPLPEERDAWNAAAKAAAGFWKRCAGDARISDGFRSICARNAALINPEKCS